MISIEIDILIYAKCSGMEYFYRPSLTSVIRKDPPIFTFAFEYGTIGFESVGNFFKISLQFL